MVKLPNLLSFFFNCLRAVPLSLAATNRISVDFFSYRYLDVSVPYVSFFILCIPVSYTHLTLPTNREV